MAGLDPTVIANNPLNAYKTNSDIALQQQQMQQARQMQPYKIQQMQAEAAGTQADTQKKQLDTAMQKNESVIQLLQGVNDQPSYDRAKQAAQGMGLPVDHLPPNYDQNTINQLTQTALSVKDKLQIQALAAYRGTQLDLKRDQINKGIGGWNPVTQSWDTGDNSTPMLGGGLPPISAGVPNQPSNPARGALTASEAGIPTPPQEANIQTNGSVGGMPLSGAANTQLASAVNAQDPVAASNAAIAAQQKITGVSPAQRPDLANMPAGQVAAMPVANQYPPNLAQKVGETTQQYRMRLQSQGIGSTSPVIYAANRIMQDAQNAGKPIPYETAFSIAKKGLAEGQTFDVNTGQIGNMGGATQATAQMAQAKDEGAGYGKGLGEQMDQYRTVAQAAQGMDATLNAMKADSDQFRMGAMSDMQGTAKSYLQAIAEGFGAKTPEMDSSLGAQQAFTKSAMGLVMGGMQKVQGRAFGEMKAIQSAFPTQAMSKGGFDLVTNQIAGTNQYSEAMYQAAQNYKNLNGTLDGFESQFQKSLSPWAFVVKNMDQQSLAALSKTLSATPQGQKELHMLADQIDYATKNGLMQ